MNRTLLAAWFCLGTSVWAAEPKPATTTVKLNGHTFTVPAGFTVDLVAGPPMVERPITADFDEQGRLYVAESSGSNEKVTIQLENPTHKIYRLEDTNGDGIFDKRTVFADKMMFPEGTMWLNGSLYVAAPPHIWKLTDTNNDGVADKREIWFDGKTLTGCANDLHGPYRGPDGYIYWCKGAFAEQTYKLPNGKSFTTKASHIFRATPDGKEIEPVMTGGMDNPVDVVFTRSGERIFTTTFFQHPAGGQRDGLIHAVYGGVYGKDHDPVYHHPWTGPELMPPMTHLGAAAPCGLHRLESDQFGPAYTDNLFAALFNMAKVTRHVLSPHGSTFRTEDSDFLVSDNRDFHPTDVLEHADGSLLVVDTGGWYKLCCPTSQLAKADVLGGIYRVRKVGSHKVEDPWGKKIAWEKLDIPDVGKRLHDPRPIVQRRAMDEAKRRHRVWEVAVTGLTGGNTEHGILNVVWLLCDDGRPPSQALVAAVANDARESVRHAAMHMLAISWSDGYLGRAADRLQDKSLAVRRVTAEALTRFPYKGYVEYLLAALADEKNDRFLDHSLTYALIEIAAPKETAEGLKHQSPRVRRAALIALDQMPNGGLKPSDVTPLLLSADPLDRATAWWIVGHRPAWAGELAGVFQTRIASPDLKPADREDLAGQLAKFAKTSAGHQFVAERISAFRESPEAARLALKAIPRSGVRIPPLTWYIALQSIISTEKSGLEREVIAAVRSLPSAKVSPPGFVDALAKFARSESIPPDVRFQALAAIPGGPGKLEPELFAELTKAVHRDNAMSLRTSAADALSKSTLTTEQLVALASAIRKAGPMELDRLLEPFARSTNEAAGLALLAALTDSPLRTTLRADMLKPRLAKYPEAIRTKAEALYASLNADAAKQSQRLDAMLTELNSGDIRRGQQVFNSAKAACASCHAIGYLGGKVGPDLTKIGGIRTERDLLEAILFPSASFVRSYEPVKVTTADGRVIQGILKQDAPEEVIVTVNATEEKRIVRADIETIQPGTVSVMPAGLEQQLSKQDFADLIAFLKASK